MKSHTDLEQSKKLAEILPLDSADMRYQAYYDTMNNLKYTPRFVSTIIPLKADIPCWSLTALLSVVPYPSLHKTFSGWRCDSYNKEGTSCTLGESSDNPVDACVEIIVLLNELKML